jgi:hypothetical protein
MDRIAMKRLDGFAPDYRRMPARLLGRAVILFLLVVAGCRDSTAPPVAGELVQVGGTAQSGIVAQPLAQPLVVRVRDTQKREMGGVTVNWQVADGNGSLGVLSAQTAPDGTASAVWTLGTRVGVMTATATVATLSPVTFTATAVTGAPSASALHEGNDQQATVGTTVAIRPSVRVRDAHDNPVANLAVVFTVTGGGGSVEGAATTTDADGIATSGQWTLGTVAGNNRLTAAATGVTPVTFNAEATAGAAASLAARDGHDQWAMIGSPVAVLPSVLVLDSHGNPVPGVMVTFAVAGGGGSITGQDAMTNTSGVATVGSWTLGPDAVLNTLTAAAGSLPIVTFTARATPVSLVLSVDAVHLNQGNQTYAGTVRGVAGRAGLLRVVVRANEANALALPVRLRLFDGATLLREVQLPAPSGSVPLDPDLAIGNHTWNLPLTAAEAIAGLTVEAVVDADNSVTVADSASKRFPRGTGTASLDLVTLAPLRITFFPIHATVQETTGAITAENVETYLTATRQWIPASAVLATVRPPYTTNHDLSVAANWSRLLQDLQAIRTAEGARDEYYHGIIGSFSGIPYGGLAYRPSAPSSTARSGLSYDRMPSSPQTIAHELGHNLGRMHAPCGSPSNIDPSYPHANASLGSAGYDLVSGGLRHPTQHRDYMSYCTPRWTSDYTFDGISEWRRNDPRAVFEGGANLAASAHTESGLLVWGQTDGHGGATLNPAFALTATPALPTSTGPNTVRALAADGSELFRLSFEGVPVEDGHDPHERHFAWFVPLDADRIATITKLELVTPAAAAAVVRAPAPDAAAVDAASLPPVRVDRAAGGRVRVRWDAGRYPMALIRDSATGHILSLARHGDVNVAALGVDPERLEVLLSDGTKSRTAIRQ